MFSLQSDHDLITDLDTVAKSLQLRFEGSAPLSMLQPVLLMRDIVLKINKESSTTELQLQNVKLQLEPLVAILCELVMSKSGDANKGKGRGKYFVRSRSARLT